MSGEPEHKGAGRPSPGGALAPWIFERLHALAALQGALPSCTDGEAQGRLFAATRSVLGGVLPFEASGFLLVDEGLDFDLASCAPAEAREAMLGEVARSIEAGSFGWALAQRRTLLLPASDGSRCLLLHALATPTRTLGMFAGLLPGERPVVARIEQELISIALHQCAAALESALLRHEARERGRADAAGEATRALLAGEEPQDARGPDERLGALCEELGWLLAGLRELAERLLSGPGAALEARDLALRVQGAARALEALAGDARQLAPDPPPAPDVPQAPPSADLPPGALAAQPPGPRAGEAGPGARGDGAVRVLVVEDNAVNQKVMARILERLGCHVDLAADGVAALECHARQRYALVFMDCRMPEMDGFETTAAIRRRERPGSRTPIVAVTADASDRDRARCLAAGMDDHVSKPVRSADLRRMLERWTGR